MKILIWQSYGRTRVYEASSQNFATLSERVIDILESRGYGDDAINCAGWAGTYAALESCVASFCEDDEAFQQFLLTDVEQVVSG